MSMFVGNTYIKVDDVRSIYSDIATYDVEDINLRAEELKDIYLIFESDFKNVMNHLREDIDKILKMLINYDTSNAIDELKILAEKLY